MYGSEEAFIQEYESILAEKLLLNTKYNISEEIKNIELLKIRFGEAKLNRCNVILKDWKDSDRFNKILQKDYQTPKYSNSAFLKNNVYGLSPYN